MQQVGVLLDEDEKVQEHYNTAVLFYSQLVVHVTPLCGGAIFSLRL